MEIDGKHLGWAVIYLVMFTYMIFIDFGLTKWDEIVFSILLILFFMWKFIVNMKKSFYKKIMF
jgi:hypothetical protein